MKKDTVYPNGWMQKNLDKNKIEPYENYSLITNIDDVGNLLKLNPKLSEKENKMNINSKIEFWSESLKNFYYDNYGSKGDDLPLPPEKDYFKFIEYIVNNALPKPNMPSNPEEFEWNPEKDFEKKFKLKLPKVIWEKIMDNLSDQAADFEQQKKESITKKVLSKAKSKPPKKWFDSMLKEVKKKNKEYSDDQAAATVGDIWFNKMKPHKKTEINKKYKKSNIVKKAIVKLANPLTYPIGKEVLNLLQEALKAEFMQWDLYYAYKSQLKGLSRDPIEEHFSDHAEEEASHIEVLQRFIVGMGENPTTERRPIPILKNNNIREIINLQLTYEIEAVELYKNILKLLTDESYPLRIEIENILSQETEHMHDLQLLLRE
jgi:bacterioferritin